MKKRQHSCIVTRMRSKREKFSTISFARCVAIVTLMSVGVFSLSACASGTSSNSSPAAIITTNGSEPQNPLIPTNTNEGGGGKIIDSLFAGLIHYNVDGKPVNDVAESIHSNDSQNYTIKIRSHTTFTNGEKVTAQSFVDAWNFGALLSNTQLGAHFFENIQGFSYETDSELTGLKVIDDTTFTVALDRPIADFPLRLGFTAFFPLPAVAFHDIAAFGEHPIGNGPYTIASVGAWRHNERIDLLKNAGYNGPRTAHNDGLSIIFYASPEASYADLIAGNLDLLDQIPESALPTYKADFGDRAINQPAALFQAFTIPERLPHFSGEEGTLRRQAISHAIDRNEITEVIFSNTRASAHDFTSPVVDGHSNDIPGSDVLHYDPEKAQALWGQANAIAPWSGIFQIAYNADGGHHGWVDAVTNGLKNVLGIEASGAPYPTFAEVRTAITDRTINTAFRTGWRAGYPGMYNFLGPLYSTTGGANDSGYSNPNFDALLNSGLEQTTVGQANQKFREAQELLFHDLPTIPLWYETVNGAYGVNISNVQFGWNSVPLYDVITKNR
jgi:oligopeptide transport system substrate-binding protein